jgi:hypothetical protein
VPSTLDLIWSQAEPLLAPAVARELGSFTTRDVYRWVQSGAHQLWVVSEGGRVLAALLSQVQPQPARKRVLVVHSAGGTRARRWIPAVVNVLEGYAHLHGCTEMRVVGRRGWQRYLEPYGYRFHALILVKDEVFAKRNGRH